MIAGTIVAVSVVHALVPDVLGSLDLTAIDKRPVPGRVLARTLGLHGDRQYDTRHHGGPDQAIYAYAREDATHWERELDRTLAPGAFGENLTTLGVDVTGAVIGEQWAVGSAVLEVSCPRIPCATFQGFWGVPQLVKRFTEHGAPGAYLRVRTEGELGEGDEVRIVHRPEHGVTLGEMFRALTGDHELLPRLLDVPDLPAWTVAKVRVLLRAGTQSAPSR